MQSAASTTTMATTEEAGQDGADARLRGLDCALDEGSLGLGTRVALTGRGLLRVSMACPAFVWYDLSGGGVVSSSSGLQQQLIYE
jgi:hypothetical protein